MRLRRLLLSLLRNALLVVAGVAVALLLLELLFCKPLLPHLPKSAYHNMIRELRVLGQTSFAGRMPEAGYVAIVGDSNAQGKGDWFTSQGYDHTADYHSAHLLRDKLGKDVLSFGRSGACSADGLLLEPVQIRAMLKRLDRPLPAPSVVLAYFYEGNDIENNLDFVQRWILPALPEEAAPTLAQMTDILSNIREKEADGHARQWNDAPICTNFLLRSLRNTLRNSFTRKYIDVAPEVPAGEVNAAIIQDRTVPLPDRLQAPPLQLTSAQIQEGVTLMQASLQLLAKAFAPARVVFVYVPAPLSCYQLASPDVSTYYGGARLFPTAQVSRASDDLYERTAQAAQELGLEVIDTRPRLRAAARKAAIHGPTDWDHLNKRGYEALAEAIAAALP